MPPQHDPAPNRAAELAAADRIHHAEAIAADMALTPTERLQRAIALSRQAWQLRAAFAPVVAERYARRA